MTAARFWGAGHSSSTNDKEHRAGNPRQKETSYNGERNISIPNYQLFLTKIYSIEKNTAPEKYVIGENVFDTLEMALLDADQQYWDQRHRDQLFNKLDQGRHQTQKSELENALREEHEIKQAQKVATTIFFLVLGIVVIVLLGSMLTSK